MRSNTHRFPGGRLVASAEQPNARVYADPGSVGDLPRIRFHDLRQTHLLSSGVHPKVAQERLGHSTISITLDLYSDVMPGMQENAASKIDAAIRAVMTMV
jgi:integrase